MPIGHLTPIPPGTPPAAPPAEPMKYFLGGGGFPFFCSLIFVLVFFGAVLYLAQTVVLVSLYFGLAFGVISLVAMYILFALKNIFRLGKIYWLNPVIAALAIFPWWFLASQPQYLQNIFEEDVSGSMVSYFTPFIFTVSVCLGLCAAWFLIAVILSIKNFKSQHH